MRAGGQRRVIVLASRTLAVVCLGVLPSVAHASSGPPAAVSEYVETPQSSTGSSAASLSGHAPVRPAVRRAVRQRGGRDAAVLLALAAAPAYAADESGAGRAASPATASVAAVPARLVTDAVSEAGGRVIVVLGLLSLVAIGFAVGRATARRPPVRPDG